MDKLYQWLIRIRNILNIVQVLLGIALVLLIFLLVQSPANQNILLLAFCVGGAMNIFNGIKTVEDKKRKNMGYSYILFGLCMIILGIAIVKRNLV
ncbi:MAG: hypothetical protein K0S47_1578 [Herbinix sp.]|jgi:peptidoglycan/LPS O-acetylase OafA/YrhL|nr:hypothetical protein [Herbinix sp.]